MKRYLWNVVLAGNRFINALTGGDADQTICTRTYCAMQSGSVIARVLVPVWDFMFSWYEADHCHQSMAREIKEGKV